MTNVFIPLNVEMVTLITANADLLEDAKMPKCLLLLGAHVNGYKGILAAWQKHNYSNHMSLTPFPIEELLPYVEEKYRDLKIRQARLIGSH